jgi:hypothetical protein
MSEEGTPRGAPATVPGGDADAPAEVVELGPGTGGRWLVRSRGSEHIFDLDAGTYRRLPGPGRGRFAHDGFTVRLGRVVRWPRVGDTFFIWVDGPELPEWVHWHQSSTNRSITQLPAEEPA